jgi:hypothetical protein
MAALRPLIWQYEVAQCAETVSKRNACVHLMLGYALMVLSLHMLEHSYEAIHSGRR